MRRQKAGVTRQEEGIRVRCLPDPMTPVNIKRDILFEMFWRSLNNIPLNAIIKIIAPRETWIPVPDNMIKIGVRIQQNP